MIYEYCPNNPEKYATNLQYNQAGKRLKFDSAKRQDVLIVKTPYDQNVLSTYEKNGPSIIELLCETMGNIALNDDGFTEVWSGVWVRFLSAVQYTQLNGCPIHGEACTYSVLACDRQEDMVKIYAPQGQAMINPFCSIPLSVKLDICRDTVSVKRMFKTIQVETGFYRVVFPEAMVDGYIDGTLQYKVGEISIPITKTVLQNGVAYILTDKPPVFITTNKGLKLI